MEERCSLSHEVRIFNSRGRWPPMESASPIWKPARPVTIFGRCRWTSTHDPIATLFIHAGLGDRDKVYEGLELASRDHSAFPTIETWLDQVLDEYADEPRFQEMYRRLRLAPRTSEGVNA